MARCATSPRCGRAASTTSTAIRSSRTRTSSSRRSATPCYLDGQLVRTGDILHGDANGVVVVPWASLGGLRDEVAAVQKAERRDMDFIDGPDFTLDGYKEIRGYGR